MPIVYDIPLPDSSVLVTSNPVLASDIAGGCFTISAQLLNTEQVIATVKKKEAKLPLFSFSIFKIISFQNP